MPRKKTTKQPKIIWNIEGSRKMLRALPESEKGRAVIKFISPFTFLNNTPHKRTRLLPASMMKEEDFNQSSLKYLREQVAQGKPLNIPYLGFKNMDGAFPSHEGRHRSFLAQELGIDKIPVMIEKKDRKQKVFL